MAGQPQGRRGGGALLIAALLFLAAFALLTLLQALNQPRFEADPDRLKEAGESQIVEEDLPVSLLLATGLSGVKALEQVPGLPRIRGDLLEERTPSADWPQWRGPRRDGVAAPQRLLTEWGSDGPTILWRADCGEGYSSFAVGGGRVYTMMRQGDQEAIVCWKADTGKEQWRRAYDCPNPPSEFGPGPRSTPCLDRDGSVTRLYAVGATGIFHCLDAVSGEVLWQHDLLQEFGAARPKWGVAFSPLIEGDLVYTNPGGPNGNSIAAFDKRTGTLRWKALDDAASYSSPIAVTAAGRRQILFFTSLGLVSVSPQGQFNWRFAWTTFSDVNAATPLVFHARAGDRRRDYVFISSGYNKGCVLLSLTGDSEGLAAHRVYEGNQMCCHFSTPVRYRDHLYGFNESRLTCMDLRSGETRWRLPSREFNKGTLILAEGYLLVVGENGRLALIEARAGEEAPPLKAQAQPRRWDRCWALPALADGLLYLRGQDGDSKGEILCLDLRQKS